MVRPTSAWLLFVGIASALLACSAPEPETRSNEATDSTKAVILPGDAHKVSPLAQLMREMTAFADSTGKRLQRGESLLPKPEHFKDMLTVESTPGMVDHRVFDPFAFAYLHQLDSLYKVPAAEHQNAFNELVQYCAACHGSVCPGPLTRINKLRVPEKAPN